MQITTCLSVLLEFGARVQLDMTLIVNMVEVSLYYCVAG